MGERVKNDLSPLAEKIYFYSSPWASAPKKPLYLIPIIVH